MNTETLGLLDHAESSTFTGAANRLAGDVRRVILPPGKVVTLRKLRPGTVMSVVTGIAWLTQEGTVGDQVLGTGQALQFTSSNPAVIESLLGEAVIELGNP